MSTPPEDVRLAELVATISLGTDLGLGQPMGHIISQTLVSLRMAELLGLDDAERHVAYYSGLLAWVGCHTDAYEQAKWFGDDLALKREGYGYDVGRPAEMLGYALRTVGAGRPALQRARMMVTMPLAMRRNEMVDLRNHWEAADALAERLGLGDDVRQSLRSSFERWDGRGAFGVAGEEIPLVSRVVSLADVVTVHHDSGGTASAVEVARRRAGTQFDPALVDLFCRNAPTLLDGVDRATGWREVIGAEPSLHRRLGDAELDEALAAMGDFADLKSPYTLGHSRSVAALAGDAAVSLGLAPERCTDVRRAAHVHDLGRLGVPNSIWDKPGALSTAETERVRMHPYLTERMLASTPALARLGAIAVQHHERLDGSGYPRGLSGGSISTEGRVLAAADCYAALTEPRPHRPAADATAAATALRARVMDGKLDGESAEAVLAPAGHRTPRKRVLPSGLTAREVEVLRLVARGLTNRQIAEELTISPSTAGSHVEHIYAKTGVRNRAGAGLFATRHGLVGDY